MIPTSFTTLAPLDPAQARFVGDDLDRPECVLALATGELLVSDWRGGVSMFCGDGGDRRGMYIEGNPSGVLPNGFALNPDGTVLVANLGDSGGFWQLQPDGEMTPYLVELDGEPIPPANFVLNDHQGRTWMTVSTRLTPRDRAYRQDVADGFILLEQEGQARLAADGLGYTNEVQVDPSGEWLYVNETFARRTSRFRIGPRSQLGPRETVCEYGAGTFPDGLCFDVEGAFWVTSIISNRVIRVTPEGEQQLLLEDADREHLVWVEEAYQANELGRPHLDQVRSRHLQNISSLAFGGDDLKTIYLGCLLGRRIASFRSPVKGMAPAHWHWHINFKG
jgi:sugar lactone lactonase YvrE